MKIVCLLPVSNDARIQRRLSALKGLGIDLDVLAFERDAYPGRALSEFQSLGTIDHGRYPARVKALLAALPRVRAAAESADAVYSFGFDLHALAWMATRRLGRRLPLLYEVADINPLMVGSGATARIMRCIERRLIGDTQLVVVTSAAFISGFYRGVQKLTRLPHLLIENKPNLESLVSAPSVHRSPSDPLTIGYFGIIRCQRSWEALQQIARRANGRVRIYLRGVPLGIAGFERDCAASPWIEYGGPYVAPADLAEMYRRIDVSWIAHRVDDNNSLLWNRTNRFYEACAFQKPMVAQAGSQDGEVVSERQLGLSIDLSDVEAAATRVLDVSWGQVHEWQRHVHSLPRSVYSDNGEHEKLANRILHLAHL
jgi:succinoglycan biosynthesis protein ExoL